MTSKHSQRFDDTVNSMECSTRIKTLFLDVGGVLLTNGWDHRARRRAAKHFELNWAEMEDRHSLNFNIYETDELTLQEYLSRVIFYKKRSFTRTVFWRFMCAQSKPYSEMIELIRKLKVEYGLKIIVLSNEARELNVYRIQKFRLAEFVDAFISSSFVRLHKPDASIFRLTLDIVQTPPHQVVYIENTALFVQIADSMGICGLLHTNYTSTRAKLSALGLKLASKST